MMGGQGMGPGMMFGYANRPAYPGWGGGLLDYRRAAAYIQEGDQIGTVNKEGNTITYSGKDITINMVAVQPEHEDQTFEVHGLTNPTLVVPLGAIVHLNLVNMDYGNNMEHGIVITPAPPPYPFMSMMATGPGLARVMPLLPWRSNKAVSDAHYAMLGATFMAQERGTYWYLCPTPQHAEKGMFGKFVVQ
jgi:rusticyanin